MSLIQGNTVTEATAVSTQVCIIGSGAGGSVLAAGLAARGVGVVVLEAGPYMTRKDFSQSEGEAYPALYQDRFARATADAAIAVLQGRSVGGSTTVNWTTCFRTPERVRAFWKAEFGLDLDLDSHFDSVEQRLNISEWPVENANNATLKTGCEALGWEWSRLRRNVKGCANSGYCGLGCPYDAKQAMLVTTIQDLLHAGGRLFSDTQVDRIEHSGGKATRVHATANGHAVTVTADKVVVAGGAINSPNLLLGSDIDPNGLVGKHTFLHPVVAVTGIYPQVIAGWTGAPQSIGSHQFIEREGPGWFMECPPLQPMLASAGFLGFGAQQHQFMAQLPHISSFLSILADGFHPEAPGGTVTRRGDGRPNIDYPVSEGMADAMRAAHIAMAKIHLAAGAEVCATLHPEPIELRSEADLSKLEEAPYGALEHSIFTAHQMGGCRMHSDDTQGVVTPDHKVVGFDNLYVVDGSVLPTSLGVNPSETIYGLAHRAVDLLA